MMSPFDSIPPTFPSQYRLIRQLLPQPPSPIDNIFKRETALSLAGRGGGIVDPRSLELRRTLLIVMLLRNSTFNYQVRNLCVDVKL
jgi:hypothetical protein